MSEPKFTKGPWYVNCQEAIYCDKHKGFFIASAHRMYGDERPEEEVIEEAKANAALISAAPDMYALLQKVVNLEVLTGYWDMKNNCSLRESIQKLLKKARGEE